MARIRIGIAGYTGSGKSAFVRYFGEGLTVLDADKEAKTFITANRALHVQLEEAFGPAAISGNIPDFNELGTSVFSSVESLKRYNEIVHPPVLKRLDELMEETPGEYVVLDAALIPLWNLARGFDFSIWIAASRDVRLARLMERSSQDEEATRRRILMQETILPAPPSPPWLYINNNGAVDELRDQAMQLRERLLNEGDPE